MSDEKTSLAPCPGEARRMVEIGGGAPVDLAKARKAAQRLTDVAFHNRDKETGELIRPHFEIPANPNDDDIILSRALDELEKLRSEAARPVEAGVAQKVRERSGQSTPETAPAAVQAVVVEQRPCKPYVPGSSPGPSLDGPCSADAWHDCKHVFVPGASRCRLCGGDPVMGFAPRGPEASADELRQVHLQAAARRVRDLWSSLDGWCPCRYADGLERVVRAVTDDRGSRRESAPAEAGKRTNQGGASMRATGEKPDPVGPLGMAGNRSENRDNANRVDSGALAGGAVKPAVSGPNASPAPSVFAIRRPDVIEFRGVFQSEPVPCPFCAQPTHTWRENKDRLRITHTLSNSAHCGAPNGATLEDLRRSLPKAADSSSKADPATDEERIVGALVDCSQNQVDAVQFLVDEIRVETIAQCKAAHDAGIPWGSP